MKDLSIQELWKQQEALLEETRTFHAQVLREVKIDKARSSLRRFLLLPISTAVFFALLAGNAFYFAATHLEAWYFIFSGGIVGFFSVLLVVASVRQLYLILSLDYQAPIIRLQKQLSKLKVVVVDNLRIAAWSLPFSPFIGVFFFKTILGLDVVETLDSTAILSVGFSVVVLEVLSLLILRALRPQNTRKNWLNWLLQGNGSQVDEALDFLQQIEAFQQEERV
ncbi:MAG TPA: hypothetical protein VJ953_05530 [Saprospiraceae bacterium]|nr:hypothetical protein [Saprospiraceae bacterium]